MPVILADWSNNLNSTMALMLVAFSIWIGYLYGADIRPVTRRRLKISLGSVLTSAVVCSLAGFAVAFFAAPVAGALTGLAGSIVGNVIGYLRSK